MVTRFFWQLTAVLTVLAALAAHASAAGRPDHVVLQFPYTHQFQFAGYYAAQAKGYFAAEGLEVELREGGFTRRPYSELTAGRAQYGIGSATYLLDRLNGAALVLVATVYQHSLLAVMVRAESDIRAPEDLHGKRLAAGSSGRYPEIAAMFSAEGLPPESYVRVEDKWEVNEIVTGEADAQVVFITDLPFDMQQQGIAVRLIRPADYGVDFYGDGLFTTETELAQHPARVAAMRRAVLRGWQYALDHPDEMIDYIVAHFPNRPAKVTRDRLKYEARQTARQINADLLELGHVNPERWRRTAETFVQLGMAKDTKRLQGFIAPIGGGPSVALPPWIFWGGGGVFALALLALLANWRLQRLVERRTAELRASEQRQREIFDLAPNPIVVEDVTGIAGRLAELRRDGVTDLRAHLAAHPSLVEELLRLKRIVTANRIALQLTGFRDRDELEHRFREIMTPQAMATLPEELLAIWEERESLTMEKVYRATGNDYHMLVNWSVNRLAGRLDFSRVRLVFTDITGMKRAQRALHESEERYRSLFETTPNPMYIFDAETMQVVMVNEAAVTRYGYSRQEFAGMTVLDLRPADEAARLARAMDEFHSQRPSVPGGSHAAGLWRHRCKDGTILIVEVFTHSLVFNGRPCVLSLPFDITAKLATERALRDSEARYRELFENAVGGVYRATPDAHFISVNPAMARLYGFETAAEMLAWNEREHAGLTYAHEDEHRRFMELLDRHGKVEGFESRLVDRHGNTLWVSETSRAVRDTDGRLLYYEGFVTDITARRRLEHELMRSSKLEAVGILAGGIAHDFNNILTVVLGNVTLAEMDTAADASVHRMLRDAKRATLRARDLTQQLLTFAKGGDPVRAAIALPELLKESAEFAMHGAKSRCEFDLDPDLWPANADKGQIGQVVQNLVINAVQAMPQGGLVTIRAGNCSLSAAGKIGALPADDYVKISVSDTGTGIAPEHLSKIFDPYFTTKQQGSGLGLATVYSIARKHQGHIEVDSRLGAGTTFHLWLPAAEHVEKTETPVPEQPAALRAKVLFMDDEEPIREMAQMFLRRLGSEVVCAADGAAAVEAYRAALADERVFDIVVMDLTVPGGMGGREAMEHLLKLDPNVRAIVSSGYSRDPVLGSYRRHGFCGILPKPYGLDQLRKAIADVLGRAA
ncbi:MAG: ABC transporter substrate-binding protein [Opitutae bacterium]|nr:ABC transporter substrate-binding protein [Opitutae bacterium]